MRPKSQSFVALLCVQGIHLTDVTNEMEFHDSPARDPPPPTPPDSTPSAEQLFTCQPLFNTPLRFAHSLYRQPLPSFRWADGGDLWCAMLDKEAKLSYRRDRGMFERHAGLDARMRSILLDWLIEVGIHLLFGLNLRFTHVTSGTLKIFFACVCVRVHTYLPSLL